MKFFYITEKNKIIGVSGTNNSIYKTVIELAKLQKTNIGFLGAIDSKNRIKASILFNCIDSKVFTQLNTFIRKYSALGILESHTETLKAESME